MYEFGWLCAVLLVASSTRLSLDVTITTMVNPCILAIANAWTIGMINARSTATIHASTSTSSNSRSIDKSYGE